MSPLRILLVDGSHFLHEVLKRVLEKSFEIVFVGEMEDFAGLPSILRTTHPDWLVLSLPPKNRLPAKIKELVSSEFPHVRIMSVSTDGSEVRIQTGSGDERKYLGLTFEKLKDLLQSGSRGD